MRGDRMGMFGKLTFVGWSRKGRGWGYGCGIWVGYRVWNMEYGWDME